MDLARVEEIFHRVRSLPPQEWEPSLVRECGDDDQLASMVRELLEFLDESGAEPPTIGVIVRRSPPEAVDTAFLENVETEPSLVHGTVLCGRYRVDEFLAAGGMGQVYRAHDLDLGVSLALKTIRPKLAENPRSLRRFKQEVLLARSITHPNVCRIFELGRDESANTSFLTMEFLGGETLASRVSKEGAQEMDESLPLVEQMADALDAAHRAGIVHGDFKSPNVMLVPSESGERAVVTDFGLAETLAELADPEDSGLRRRTSIVGTPAYMAPEQLTGRTVGAHSDLYALGVVLYEMATGQLPFSEDTPLEMARAHIGRAPSRPSSVRPIPERWEEMILRLMSKDPNDRFATARDALLWLNDDGIKGHSVSVTLPPERDAFVGREEELRTIGSLLEHRGEVDAGPAPGSPVRLLTLRGPGGTGKTRLAQKYGWDSVLRWPGGVCFCDLSEARDLSGIVSALASVLNVQLTRQDPIQLLGRALSGRGRALLVLDNFEQVAVHAAGTVGKWLAAAPEIRFLVTSRELLRLPGEESYEVEPLHPLTRGVELFESRAWGHRPGFAVDAENRRLVEDIVQELDGLPLAIELAAARLRELDPEELGAGLQDRFRVLSGGRAGRHQTMRTTLDWSWDLLSPWERSAMAQASMFDGGFTLEAAEAVLDCSAHKAAPSTFDILQSLVDKSWLRAKVSRRAPRFETYVTVQDYAAARLKGAFDPTPETPIVASSQPRSYPSPEDVARRHGSYFGRYGDDAAIRSLDVEGGVDRRAELELEFANLLAASRRAVNRADTETAVANYLAVAKLYQLRGPFTAGLDLGLELLGLDVSPTARVALLMTVAQLRFDSGMLAEGRESYEEALKHVRNLGNRHREGVILGKLSIILRSQGLVDEARTLGESAVRINREVGDRVSEAVALTNLGVLQGTTGQIHLARTTYEEALAIHREVGNRRQEGLLLGNLAILYREQGHMATALETYEAALAVHREVGARQSEGIVLGNLGNLHRGEGRPQEARRCYEEALQIMKEIGNRQVYGLALGNLGDLLKEEGKPEEAREAYESSLEILREVGARRFEAIKLSSLGELHRIEGRLDMARRCFDEAEPLLREVEDLNYLGQLLGSRAHLEIDLGDNAAARTVLGEVRGLAEQLEVNADSELGQKVTELESRLGLEHGPR